MEKIIFNHFNPLQKKKIKTTLNIGNPPKKGEKRQKNHGKKAKKRQKKRGKRGKMGIKKERGNFVLIFVFQTIISSCRAYSITCVANSVEGIGGSSAFCCLPPKL